MLKWWACALKTVKQGAIQELYHKSAPKSRAILRPIICFMFHCVGLLLLGCSAVWQADVKKVAGSPPYMMETSVGKHGYKWRLGS